MMAVEHLGVFQGMPIKEAEATGAVVGEGDAPAGTSWPSSASSSPLRPLLTAPTG
ncbi:MAG: hypothetical protein WKF75_12950 [Singulisphaera sp.]